ncbi:hypothetical protein Xcab_04113 [Xenorhabdus cabanillasii JM26]|nr:hypothetical protein Xcab_04113 [Xenorhabdus cabanillasii JM26]
MFFDYDRQKHGLRSVSNGIPKHTKASAGFSCFPQRPLLVSRPTQSPKQAPCILKFDYHKNDLAQCTQLASP